MRVKCQRCGVSWDDRPGDVYHNCHARCTQWGNFVAWVLSFVVSASDKCRCNARRLKLNRWGRACMRPIVKSVNKRYSQRTA